MYGKPKAIQGSGNGERIGKPPTESQLINQGNRMNEHRKNKYSQGHSSPKNMHKHNEKV